jgi:plastocyanin
MVIASVATAGTAAAGGTVAGKVAYKEGTQPPQRKLAMAADPICASKHEGGQALSEAVLVNGNGTLRNVFVYVSSEVKGTFKAPAEPAVIDQHGCLYKPRVLGMMAGQTLRVLNSDGTLHNVHPKPQVNTEFNLAMPKFMKQKDVVFEKPEQMIPVKCDVHPWMQGHIAVMSHPFFAVTGETGSFSLPNLPAGKYTLTAWHETFGTKTGEVTVAEGGTASIDFTFELADAKKN